ncbi:hypothetical protein B0H14DRAFT_2645708 [Mycena olivaceomarginata]|nr:hypothetical protein B0H14DRAFT_2645708 [Mycena olivaceomarginata]
MARNHRLDAPIEVQGIKFWIQSQPKDMQNDLMDTHTFDHRDPDNTSLDTQEYEVTALPPGSRIFLQQPGRCHAVIGAGSTVTVGGYFFSVSSMCPGMSITFHTFFIRICMFWLNVTQYHRGDDGPEPPTWRLFRPTLCAQNMVIGAPRWRLRLSYQPRIFNTFTPHTFQDAIKDALRSYDVKLVNVVSCPLLWNFLGDLITIKP